MKYSPDNWYEWLEEQSKTDHIYTLIHGYLPYNLEINHDRDFVVLQKSTLPDALKNIPERNISKQNRIEKLYFDSSDYIILDNNSLTQYLEAAKAMQVKINIKKENFIELLFAYPENDSDTDNDTESATPYIDLEKVTPQTLLNKEDAIAACWQIIVSKKNASLALEYAKVAAEFLHEKIKLLTDSNSTLEELFRVMMGYNIIAVAYAWNNEIDKAAEADKFYIYEKQFWSPMSSVIKPYLELLVHKKQGDYLAYLFSNTAFKKYFLAHYEAYVSLLIDDNYPLTKMSEVVNIINRINAEGR